MFPAFTAFEHGAQLPVSKVEFEDINTAFFLFSPLSPASGTNVSRFYGKVPLCVSADTLSWCVFLTGVSDRLTHVWQQRGHMEVVWHACVKNTPNSTHFKKQSQTKKKGWLWLDYLSDLRPPPGRRSAQPAFLSQK